MRTSRTFATREEAELWAQRIEAPLLPPPKPDFSVQASLRTFGDVLKQFEQREVPRRPSGEAEVYMLRHLHRHWIADVPCGQLSSQHFAAYRDERLQSVKPGTVQRLFNLLRPILDLTRDEWGVPITGNPARQVTVRVGDDSRTGRLTPEEMGRFLSALRRDPNPEAIRAVELALETAMRRSELLTLTWDQVDLAAGTAFLPKTKNGHSRTVALSPRAIELLQGVPGRRGPVLRCSPSSVRRAFARARAKAGLEDFCFHQTRHEAISRMWELGLSELEISNQSGHRDWRSLRRYSHVQATTLAAKLRQLQGGPGANPSGAW